MAFDRSTRDLRTMVMMATKRPYRGPLSRGLDFVLAWTLPESNRTERVRGLVAVWLPPRSERDRGTDRNLLAVGDPHVASLRRARGVLRPHRKASCHLVWLPSKPGDHFGTEPQEDSLASPMACARRQSALRRVETPKLQLRRIWQRLTVQIFHADLIARAIESRLFNVLDFFLHKFLLQLASSPRQ